MIKNFKEFIFEKVEISDNFLKTTQNIKHPIADFISYWYSKNNTDTFYDNIELDELPLLLATKGNKFEKIKIGKFLRKILPANFKAHQIEEFINLIKRNFVEIGDFEILKGEDIKKAYHPHNFTNVKIGSLWTSCLSLSQRQNNLQLYCDNSNISVIVLYDQFKKIIGRALLWKAIHNNKNVILMDEVYSIDYKDNLIYSNFLNFAKENNFLRIDLINEIVIDVNKKVYKDEFIVNLENVKFNMYPFVDFFKYIDLSKKCLSNKNGEYSLQATKSGILEFGILACKTCHGKSVLLCPACEGTGVDSSGNKCQTCGGDYTFIKCPDC
jgi:hypothetical protein